MINKLLMVNKRLMINKLLAYSAIIFLSMLLFKAAQSDSSFKVAVFEKYSSVDKSHLATQRYAFQEKLKKKIKFYSSQSLLLK